MHTAYTIGLAQYGLLRRLNRIAVLASIPRDWGLILNNIIISTAIKLASVRHGLGRKQTMWDPLSPPRVVHYPVGTLQIDSLETSHE